MDDEISNLFNAKTFSPRKHPQSEQLLKFQQTLTKSSYSFDESTSAFDIYLLRALAISVMDSLHVVDDVEH